MLAAMSYPPSGALFERNPVCGVCWRVCMQMCEDRGGSLNFDLLRSMEQADRLCARLVADTWSLCGIEHYYHWLEAQLSYSRPAVACATATVCLTLALMEQVPEPLRQLSRDMRGLLYGEAGELYDTMRTTACRQDITLSATTYGAPPAITPQQALINKLLNEKQQLKNQLQAMSKTQKVHIGYNVEQMTINMSGGTLVQHADLVQAGGEVKVQTCEQQQAEPAPKAEYFCRITEAAIRDGKAQQIDDELRSAAVTAPKLIKAIRTNEALGYLDTKNLSSTELFSLLDEHYTLPFKYRQFTQERSR